MNLCSECGRDFASVRAFDRHRVGRHSHRWTLDTPDGRRCLDADELETWDLDARGRLRMPGEGTHPPQDAAAGGTRGIFQMAPEECSEGE